LDWRTSERRTYGARAGGPDDADLWDHYDPRDLGAEVSDWTWVEWVCYGVTGLLLIYALLISTMIWNGK
jgi:hypothetical protein